MLIDAIDDGGATAYFDPDPGSYQRYFVVVSCEDSPEQGAISFSIEPTLRLSCSNVFQWLSAPESM